MFVCLTARFSAISKPTGPPFGTKLHFGPGKVLKQQYLGKRKKCGNAARNTSFLAVLVKYLGHFETDLDAFWHEITFWSYEGCKTSIFGKTQKMWQRCTENVISNLPCLAYVSSIMGRRAMALQITLSSAKCKHSDIVLPVQSLMSLVHVLLGRPLPLFPS